MSVFQTCRRKYALRTVHRLRPKVAPNWSRFGKAFHKFDEAYHSGLSTEEAIAKAREVFWEGIEDAGEAKETWEPFVQIVNHYSETYPVIHERVAGRAVLVREPLTRLTFFPELLEIPFRAVIYTPGGRKSHRAIYSGVLDGIVEDAERNLWVYETKTAANLTEAFFDKLGFDRQTLRYVYAGRQIFGPRLKGVLYNVVSKSPARLPSKRQDGGLSTAPVVTTPAMFLQVLAECAQALRPTGSFTTLIEIADSAPISEAAAYFAHILNEDTTEAWIRLERRAEGEPTKSRETLLKRVAKAKQDQEKYREQLVAAEKRLFQARRFRAVDDIELEEIQSELFELDQAMHEAEKNAWFWPNDRACDMFGGCEYREYCLKGNTQKYEEAPAVHVELPEEGFLTATNPRPIRSQLTNLAEFLVDASFNDD
jgi:hypothetical protein